MFEQYPDVISVADICEILHIGKRSAYNLLHEGKISYRRIGRIYHIPKSSVISFILQNDFETNVLNSND